MAKSLGSAALAIRFMMTLSPSMTLKPSLVRQGATKGADSVKVDLAAEEDDIQNLEALPKS